MTRKRTIAVSAIICYLSSVLPLASAAVFSVTVDGPDAIFLAGRTDVVIPPANQPWNIGTFLVRHGGPTPEEALESVPPFIGVAGGDIIRVLNPAVGGINFFNGFGPPFFGPDGDGVEGSSLSPLGGISGYIGPRGPLAGVFLDNAIPNGSPPVTLDFSTAGLGTNFAALSPLLGQVFYIGDGVTSGNAFQLFTAPAGATRLFFAIPDGFGFGGAPGAYDDNDGSYVVRVGVNEIPTRGEIPEPGALAIWTIGAFSLWLSRRRQAKLTSR